MCEEQRELLVRAQILLGADPDGPNTVLVIRPKLRRTSPDPPFSAYDDEFSIASNGQPLQVTGTARDLGQILMTRIEDIVTATASQQLTQT